MRVLFLVEQFWPYVGGVQVWAARLLPRLRDRGWDIAVATSHCGLDLPDRDQYKGLEVHRFPFWESVLSRDPGQVARTRRQFADLKASFRPDLMHVNLLGPVAYFHAATPDASRSPTLVSLHDPLKGHGTRPDSLFGQVLRAAAWVTAGSRFVLDDARRTVPGITPRSSLVYQGADAPSLPPAPLPTDPPQLLCVGRLTPGKAFDVAIDALRLVRQRFPSARLVIASDGPERRALEQQAGRLGIAEAVEFRGWTEFPQMPILLNSATVVVVPSRSPEGFGLVALEAALMERPVVATRSGALPEVVADGETGLLVERDDAQGLAAAIVTLLAHPEAAAAMGRAARRRARALFGLEPHVDSFDALYHQLAGGQRLRDALPAGVTRATTP